jgi:transposase-like protein
MVCAVKRVAQLRLSSAAFTRTRPIANGTQCRACGRQFDDLTGTILEGHHQPLRTWVLCLYFMGLNLSNQQIAAELELHPDDVHDMTTHLREGIVLKKSPSP